MNYLSLIILFISATTLFGLSPHVYVTDELDSSIEILDVNLNTVEYIRGFDSPRVIKIIPEGSLAFVGEETGKIKVVHTKTNLILPINITAGRPIAFAITPNSQYLYATSSNNTVTVIHIPSFTTQAVLSGFHDPEDIKISPNGHFAYIVNQPIGTISVVDTSTNTVCDTITGMLKPTGLSITNSGAYGYVTDTVHNVMYQINLSTNTLITTILGFSSPKYLVITPDDLYAFVTNPGDNSVIKLRLADNKILEQIPIPGPKSIAITPDGKYLYIGSTYGIVFKISIANPSLILPLPGFKNPSNITVSINNPPANTMNGCQMFMSPTAIQNLITWGPIYGNPSTFELYKDVALTKLIVKLPSTQTQFIDTDLIEGQIYEYYLLAKYPNGFSSTQGFVIVPPSRTCLNL